MLSLKRGRFPLPKGTAKATIYPASSFPASGCLLPHLYRDKCRGNDVEDLAVRFAPSVEVDTSILLICSSRFAGLMFLKTLRKLGVPQDRLPAVADFHVSPFVSRGNSDDQVNMIALKNEVSIAAQTPTMTKQILQDFQGTFSNISPVESSLELNLQKCASYSLILTNNFKGGTSPRIYPWNQSKIPNLKSSSPRIYTWGKSKI